MACSSPMIRAANWAADHMDALVRNAVEALSLYAGDAGLPPPSTIDRIEADSGIASELAAGAFLVAIPLIEFPADRP